MVQRCWKFFYPISHSTRFLITSALLRKQANTLCRFRNTVTPCFSSAGRVTSNTHTKIGRAKFQVLVLSSRGVQNRKSALPEVKQFSLKFYLQQYSFHPMTSAPSDRYRHWCNHLKNVSPTSLKVTPVSLRSSSSLQSAIDLYRKNCDRTEAVAFRCDVSSEFSSPRRISKFARNAAWKNAHGSDGKSWSFGRNGADYCVRLLQLRVPTLS